MSIPRPVLVVFGIVLASLLLFFFLSPGGDDDVSATSVERPRGVRADEARIDRRLEADPTRISVGGDDGLRRALKRSNLSTAKMRSRLAATKDGAQTLDDAAVQRFLLDMRVRLGRVENAVGLDADQVDEALGLIAALEAPAQDAVAGANPEARRENLTELRKELATQLAEALPSAQRAIRSEFAR